MAKTQKKNSIKQKPITAQFHRWLLPGLLTVTLYLISALILALFVKHEGGVTPEGGFIISTLTVFVFITFAWWLIESARWVIIYIDKRSSRQSTVAKKSKTKKK